VYAYDQCAGELSPVFCIEPTAPAPALSRFNLALVVSLLVLIGGVAFRRRHLQPASAVAKRRE